MSNQSLDPSHKIINKFQIEYIQFLDKNSQFIKERPEFATDEWLVSAYSHMVLARVFDNKAIALQRTGQMGTFPSALGQEAFAVAMGMSLEEKDVFVPYYRDHATQLLRGHNMEDTLLYWGGDERGSVGGPVQDFPVCVPIATQVTHAAGAASAIKMRNQDQVVMVSIGDGGTSKGDFFESLNVAGVWQLPLIVLVNNNQYAISVPREMQCAAQTLAQKAIGAGIHGVQVDGNDVMAVYKALEEARARAKQHKGATLIEAITYRLGDHTTADDATRYRENEEVKDAWDKEPIKRLQLLLNKLGIWDEDKEKELQAKSAKQVDAGVQKYLSFGQATPESMFDYLYDEFPSNMNEQLELLQAKISRMNK